MAAKEYRFKYGKTEVSFNLDPQMVMGELTIKDHPPLKDPVAEIQKAIRNPIQSKPFREIVKPGETVCFLVNDPTRVANSHVFMPLLLNELNSAGDSRQGHVHHVCRGGPPHASRGGDGRAGRRRGGQTGEDVQQRRPGPHAVQHAGTTSRGNDVYFHKRVVEADHIVCTGSIVYHFFAGFGGGRKALFPGVAPYETHLPQPCPDARSGSRHGQAQGESRL